MTVRQLSRYSSETGGTICEFIYLISYKHYQVLKYPHDFYSNIIPLVFSHLQYVLPGRITTQGWKQSPQLDFTRCQWQTRFIL